MPRFNFCPGCGRRLQSDADAFCPECGYQLRRPEPAAPHTPPHKPPTTYAPPPEPRTPHSWMDTAETTPRPVVPLAPPEPQTRPLPPATPTAPPFVPATVFACPECGGIVTRGAFACPRCGQRFAAAGPQAFQPPKPFSEKWLGMLLIALLAAVLIVYFC